MRSQAPLLIQSFDRLDPLEVALYHLLVSPLCHQWQRPQHQEGPLPPVIPKGWAELRAKMFPEELSKAFNKSVKILFCIQVRSGHHLWKINHGGMVIFIQ